MKPWTLEIYCQDVVNYGTGTYNDSAPAAISLARLALATGSASIATVEILARYDRWSTSAMFRSCGRTPIENLLTHARKLGMVDIPLNAICPLKRVSRAGKLPLAA